MVVLHHDKTTLLFLSLSLLTDGVRHVSAPQVLKNGKRLVIGRVSIFSEVAKVGDVDESRPVAHATLTYSTPPK